MTIDKVQGGTSNRAGTGPRRKLRDVETAAAVRDIMRAQTVSVVGAEVPKKLIGRVVTMDLVGLKCTVWLVGDEAPIEVNLFSGAIPGKWTSRYNAAQGLPDTPTQGYGSMVAVELLNGSYYVTDVLTGGQFSKELESVDLGVVARVPETSASSEMIESQKNQTLMNGRLLDGLTTVETGQAVMFGPFLHKSGTMTHGVLKMTVKGTYGLKSYNLVFDPGSLHNVFGDPEPYFWWTILPEVETPESYPNDGDFDLEVVTRYVSGYGDDLNGNEQDEVWFRIVNRSTDSTPIYEFTIDSTCFQSCVSPQTGQLVQLIDVKPSHTKGYIGMHNSASGALHALDHNGGFDVFGRVIAAGGTALGNSDTEGVSWDAATSGVTVSADGESATLTAAATNFLSYAVLNHAAMLDGDIYLQVWAPPIPLTQNIQLGATMRYDNTSNNYRIGLEFLASPAGNVRVTIGETVAGFANHALGSGSNHISTPLTDRVHLRAQFEGTRLRGKLWFNDEVEPEAWDVTVTDASLTTAEQTGIFVRQAAGGTNTFPLDMRFIEIRSKPIEYNEISFFQEQWDTGPFRAASLSLASRIQDGMTHDGVFSWSFAGSPGHISWTDNVILQSAGRSRHTLRNGIAYVGMPAVGSEIQCYNNYTVSSTVTSAGIPLDVGQSLWVAVAPGTGYDDLKTKLFIVDHTFVGDVYDNFDIPEWAVMIASRAWTASDIHLVKIYNGQYIQSVTVEDVEAGTVAVATATNTAISPTCGVAFIAPQTGKVEVFMSALGVAPAVGNWTLATFIVREGATVGSGTTFLGASNDSSVQWDVPNACNFGGSFLVPGLTPGKIYNVEMLNRGNTALTRNILRRRLIVTPSMR